MLLEALVAITIITVMMTALTGFFVTVSGTLNHQRSNQSAARVSTSAVESVEGLGAIGAWTGRGATSVALQFSSAPSAVQPWLSGMNQTSDPNAALTAGASAALPTTGVTTTLNGVTYTTNYYVGTCYEAEGSTSTSCTPTCTVVCTPESVSGWVSFVRVVIAVGWLDRTCPSTGCSQITAVLLNGDANPEFDTNQAPPPQPKMVAISNQTAAVNDVITSANGLQVSASQGVPVFVFTATGLPPGLQMNTGGLVTGTPTTQGTYSVVVTVTDGFQNTGSTTFSWKILPPLVINLPGAQTGVVGSASSLTLTATGGAGSPYTWTASGLPSGLSMSTSGTISGTPASSAPQLNPYPVTVTVTDSSGTRRVSGSFNWTITYAPLAPGNPGQQKSTVNAAATSVTLSASGGSGAVTWTLAGSSSLPAGISLSRTGVLSGTPSAVGSTSVTVTATDASGSLTPSNPQNVTFTWVVNARPTLATPPNQSGEVGVAESLAVTASGGTTAYSYSATNLPTGLSINSATGTITGTPTAAGTWSPTVAVTDAMGASAATSTFSWTIIAGPAVTLTNRQSSYATAVTLNLASLTSGGSGGYTYSVSGLPSGLTATGAGVISGTTASSVSSSTVSVTVTDSAGGTSRSSFTWNVTNLATASDPKTTALSSSGSFSLSTLVSGGAGGYTFSSVSGLPAGLSVNSAGQVSGTTGSSYSANTVTYVVTDSNGATTTGTFTWYVSSVRISVSTQSSTHSRTITAVNLGSSASNGTAPYTYVFTGLPPGLTATSAGVVSGTTSATKASYTVSVVATDATGKSAATTFTWTVT